MNNNQNAQFNHKFNINNIIINTISPNQSRNKLKIQNLGNSKNSSRDQRLKSLSQKRQANESIVNVNIFQKIKFRNTRSNQKQKLNNGEIKNPYQSRKLSKKQSIFKNINNSIQKSAELLQKKSNSHPAKKFENNFRLRVYTNVFHKKSDPRIKEILQKQRKQLFLNNDLKSNSTGQVYQKIYYRKFINIKPTIPNNNKIQEEDEISKRYIQNQIFTFQNQSLEFGYDEQIDKKLQKKYSNHESKKSTESKNFRRKKFEKSAELETYQFNKDPIKSMESSNIQTNLTKIDHSQQKFICNLQSSIQS